MQHICKSHLDMIENIVNIKCDRAIVPDDTVSFDINAIDTEDTSHQLSCAAIYAQFKQKLVPYAN